MAFSFPTQTVFEPENFVPMSFNAEALQAVDRLLSCGYGMLYMYGPQGCGKSHLLHLAAARLGVEVCTPHTLPEDPTKHRVLIVDLLEEASAHMQEKLFHFYNHLKARGGVFIIASKVPANHLVGFLPDLTSRLKTLEHVAFKNPDTAHLELLLVKFAADRQLQLEPAVVRYILKRADRSPRVLEGLVALLDEKSLEKAKPVSIPFVKNILENLEENKHADC